MHKTDYYHELRDVYRPPHPRLIFIAESPPASGLYFYDPTGKVSEPLFRALMQDVLGMSPVTKAEGLRAFKKAGYLLVDSTYFPVNKHLKDKERNNRIVADYSLLLADLLNVLPSKETKIILIKANVCRLLEPKLLSDGFNVINGGKIVPFPAFGNQTRFREAIATVLS